MSWKLQSLIAEIPQDFIVPIEKEAFKEYANYAQDDGTRIFPSVKTIVKKTGRSRRTIQRTTKTLRKKGYLILVKPSTPRSTAEYKIDVDFIKNIICKNKANITNDEKSFNSGASQWHPRGVTVAPQRCQGDALILIEPLIESFKINTSYFQKSFSFNVFNLKNFSYEQKPMSVEINLACSKEIILDQAPALETEQPSQEEKIVETFPNSSLKAEDVKAPKEFKAKKKATKAKPAKVIKTRINPNLELTSERRQIGLNARFLNRGLVEGVIETEFESFIDYFTETGTLRSDWDLSWKNWCKKAIELDKYNRKTIENPIRSGMTVSAPNEEKISIDSSFVGFVKEKLNGMQFEFEGATYAEVDDRIVIDQQNSFRRELIEKMKDRLQQYFGKEIELKWLRNSWVIPTVSKQETEIVTAKSAKIEATKIVTSDVSVPLPKLVPSPASSPLYVEEIHLETSPVFEAKTLPQELSDSSGVDVSSNYVKLAMQQRLAAVRGYQIDSDSLCEENNNSSLTEEKNDQEEVENACDENQFYQSEQMLEPNSSMISASVDAVLAADQPKPNEDLQENRSEISIDQLCLEFSEAISAKPVEEEIRPEVMEEINNLSPSRVSNPTSAISNSPIKLSKPTRAFHLPKFPVTATKSFSDFPPTAKRLSDCAEMIRVNLINAKFRKEMPPGFFKPPQKSTFKPHCDIIPAKVVINAAQAVNGR